MKKLITLVLAFTIYSSIYAQATLPAFWTFTNPTPTEDSTVAPTGWKTRLNISVTGSTPYIYATGSDGNQACRLDGTGEYVQLNFAEKPGQLSFYIKGTGISPGPAFAGTFKVQESVDGSTWNDLRIFTSMTSAFTKYTNVPAATSRFIRFFYTDKQSGSNVALDSVYLAKPVAGSNPSIVVKHGSTALATGSTYVNGTVGSSIFTIKNGGIGSALVIGNIAVSGMNASDYSITNAPSSVPANDSATFTVNFTPGAQGSRFASITINNSDSDNAAFVINLYGIGGSYASEPTAQPTSLGFSNVKAYTYNVSYVDPTVRPEAYLVLRKKGSPVTEVPLDGQTYQRGDYIGNAQVAYVGSGNSFKSVDVVAATTYYYAVFSLNGPPSFENYLTASPLTNNVTSLGGNPGTYYNTIVPTAVNFVSALHAKINTHDTIFYGNYTPTMINDFVTRDTSAARKVVYCVYTGIPYIYTEPFVWWGNGTGGTLTREHTFAQSWMPSNQGNPSWPNAPGGTKELPEYNDQHHLFPANQTQGNNVRSNHAFGKVVSVTSQNGDAKLGTDANGQTVYEPRDQQKGDLARALFYMCTAYHGVNGQNWSLGAISQATQKDSILKAWHQQDPPDAFEIARNEYVFSIQHNRNPFIDHPEWVNLINFNNMTYKGDTAPVKHPALAITEPTLTSVWEKNKTVVVSWVSNDVDSVFLFFSSDSLKTLESMGPAVGAQNHPLNLTYNFSMKTSSGIILIMDPASGAADTSSYFMLKQAEGLDQAVTDGQVSVYPNPLVGGRLNITTTCQQPVTWILSDVQGRELRQGNFTGQTEINFEDQAHGVFVLQLNANGKNWFSKILY